jgi:hypothetical protein
MRHMRRRMHVESSLLSCDRILSLHASYEEEDTCMRHMRRRMHVESSLLSCDRMLGLHVMLESTFLKFN